MKQPQTHKIIKNLNRSSNGKNKIDGILFYCKEDIKRTGKYLYHSMAQWLARWAHNPEVIGSSPITVYCCVAQLVAR